MSDDKRAEALKVLLEEAEETVAGHKKLAEANPTNDNCRKMLRRSEAWRDYLMFQKQSLPAGSFVEAPNPEPKAEPKIEIKAEAKPEPKVEDKKDDKKLSTEEIKARIAARKRGGSS